ncbi:MAG TPA: efflux RND transporter periplasmic adaptor subunit [Alphaproteobacteria bacterium]|nr:efflux RND transporter periplasmic adaptor subunit [Alphaproteobacteria bacterium]
MLAGLAAGAVWWLQRDRTRNEASYITETVALGDVEETVSALGSLQPLQYVDVGTQVSGQLQKIYVDYGDSVKEGQLLAQIDPTIYQAKVGADEAQLLSLKAQVQEKEAQTVLAEQQFKRQKDLLAARATSQDAYDAADANRKVTAAQIDQLQAQIKQTESTLNGDRANLGYTKIYAPMTGTVVSITARQGQTLNANQTAPIILRVANLDTMTVWTQVSEADAPKLKLGMPAYFTTLGKPDQRRYGKLRQIIPTPETINNVVLYDSLFDVANPNHDLLPQMSAQVFFVLDEAKQVPLVPVAALRPIPDSKDRNRFTVRVLENGEPVEREVETGVTNRLMAQVVSGLAVGDTIVLDRATGGESNASRVPSAARTPRI